METPDGHLVGDKTTLPCPLTLRLQSWAVPDTGQRILDGVFSFSPLPDPFVFLVTQVEKEKKKEKNSRVSRRQGVKLAKELPNKCVVYA